MKHASLFTGIGGFDLAAQWMVWENIFQVEIDPFCQKVLTKNFPHVKRYGDIKEFDGTKYRGAIDVLSGGFPCQPYSIAGQRKGTEDARHLWPENYRIIGEIQPPFVVGENVYGLLNWNEGMVFEQIKTDLENIGYEVSLFVLPACGVDAPHKRDRVWIIAYSSSYGYERRRFIESRSTSTQSEIKGNKWEWIRSNSFGDGATWTTSDTYCKGLQRGPFIGSIGSIWENSGKQFAGYVRSNWKDFPTQPPVRIGNDGLSSGMVRHAVKAAGNAIVPQVAYQIFKAIEETNLSRLGAFVGRF